MAEGPFKQNKSLAEQAVWVALNSRSVQDHVGTSLPGPTRPAESNSPSHKAVQVTAGIPALTLIPIGLLKRSGKNSERRGLPFSMPLRGHLRSAYLVTAGLEGSKGHRPGCWRPAPRLRASEIRWQPRRSVFGRLRRHEG